VIETEIGCSFRVGSKIDPRAVTVQWISETQATAVARRARKHAGDSPDAATAGAALAQAAAEHRTTLTPNTTAIERARSASQKLDGYLESLRARGAMKEFTKVYRRRRLAATARGEGFMSYAVAEARLRKALIPYLVGGRTIGPVQSLFEQIFDR
jgi:hypothetical protein